MASSIPPKTSHLERTAAEPRDQSLHTVKLGRIVEVNETTRLFRLEIPASGPGIRFLPGQWLDVFCPGIPRAGGFTITSPPSLTATKSQQPGYLELAVQKSPGNPPAAWLWQDPPSSILGQALQVRVGGSFVWPPPTLAADQLGAIRRVVLVAGGVGINPLMSMLSDIAEQKQQQEESKDDAAGLEVRLLYSIKDPGPERRDAANLLFLERIAEIFASGRVKGELQLYLTGAQGGGSVVWKGGEIPFRGRRITREDLRQAVGEDTLERKNTVAYVCGVPNMTDEFVKELSSEDGLGMGSERVLCEKWW